MNLPTTKESAHKQRVADGGSRFMQRSPSAQDWKILSTGGFGVFQSYERKAPQPGHSTSFSSWKALSCTWLCYVGPAKKQEVHRFAHLIWGLPASFWQQALSIPIHRHSHASRRWRCARALRVEKISEQHAEFSQNVFLFKV